MSPTLVVPFVVWQAAFPYARRLSSMVRVVSCLAISELPLPLREQLQSKLLLTRAFADGVSVRASGAASSGSCDGLMPDLAHAVVDGVGSLASLATT